MQSDLQRMRLSFGAALTPAVKVILWINVAVFLSLQVVKHRYWNGVPYAHVILDILGLNPSQLINNYAIWQLVTYAFVHMAFFHLLFNMLALWWFGSDIELHMGTKAFVRYYFFTAAGAGVVSAFFGIPTIGASGGVYGLLLAYGLMFPNRILYVYFVIPIRAKYCVFLFGLLEFLALMSSDPSGINHSAHLSGIGFGLLWFFFPRRKISLLAFWRNYKKVRMRKKLKIIRDREDSANRSDDFDNRTIH